MPEVEYQHNVTCDTVTYPRHMQINTMAASPKSERSVVDLKRMATLNVEKFKNLCTADPTGRFLKLFSGKLKQTSPWANSTKFPIVSKDNDVSIVRTFAASLPLEADTASGAPYAYYDIKIGDAVYYVDVRMYKNSIASVKAVLKETQPPTGTAIGFFDVPDDVDVVGQSWNMSLYASLALAPFMNIYTGVDTDKGEAQLEDVGIKWRAINGMGECLFMLAPSGSTMVGLGQGGWQTTGNYLKEANNPDFYKESQCLVGLTCFETAMLSVMFRSNSWLPAAAAPDEAKIAKRKQLADAAATRFERFMSTIDPDEIEDYKKKIPVTVAGERKEVPVKFFNEAEMKKYAKMMEKNTGLDPLLKYNSPVKRRNAATAMVTAIEASFKNRDIEKAAEGWSALLNKAMYQPVQNQSREVVRKSFKDLEKPGSRPQSGEKKSVREAYSEVLRKFAKKSRTDKSGGAADEGDDEENEQDDDEDEDNVEEQDVEDDEDDEDQDEEESSIRRRRKPQVPTAGQKLSAKTVAQKGGRLSASDMVKNRFGAKPDATREHKKTATKGKKKIGTSF